MRKVFLLLTNLICAAWSDQGLSGELKGQAEGQCEEDGLGQSCKQEALRDGDAFIQAQVLAKRISRKADTCDELEDKYSECAGDDFGKTPECSPSKDELAYHKEHCEDGDEVEADGEEGSLGGKAVTLKKARTQTWLPAPAGYDVVVWYSDRGCNADIIFDGNLQEDQCFARCNVDAACTYVTLAGYTGTACRLTASCDPRVNINWGARIRIYRKQEAAPRGYKQLSAQSCITSYLDEGSDYTLQGCADKCSKRDCGYFSRPSGLADAVGGKCWTTRDGSPSGSCREVVYQSKGPRRRRSELPTLPSYDMSTK